MAANFPGPRRHRGRPIPSSNRRPTAPFAHPLHDSERRAHAGRVHFAAREEHSMVDPVHVALASAPLVAPIVRTPDELPLPPPLPTSSDDPFGPAVIIGPSVQSPDFVIYDAQGRLTTSVPAHPGNDLLPPARIDVSHPDAPRSLIYTD
jgi:hypothetical protein